MKNNLVEHKFSDIYEMGSGISTKPEQAGHGFPFISFSTIFNNPVLPDEISDLMDTSEKERVIYSVKKGDVLLTRTSETIDELAMSSVAIKDYLNATFSGFAKRLRPIKEGVVYPQFMAYFLRSDYFRKIINCKSIMTLRASFNEEIFSYIKAMMPSYSEQIKIGDLCFLIEKKIRNNNKINAELESMAKTLYDYWFLQFEFPNEEGKPYKSSGGKMVWNEELKREIPENWENSTLSKVSNMYQPKTFDAKLLDDNGIFRVYGAGGYMGQYNKFNHAQSEVFISCRGSCGNVYKSMPFSLITGNAMIVHSADERLFNYLYLTLLRIGVKNCITGSVQPQITRDSLNDWKLVVPNAELIVKFNQIISPLLKKQEEIINENQELTSLRDFLLPMLMNGQVTFKGKSYEQ